MKTVYVCLLYTTVLRDEHMALYRLYNMYMEKKMISTQMKPDGISCFRPYVVEMMIAM